MMEPRRKAENRQLMFGWSSRSLGKGLRSDESTVRIKLTPCASSGVAWIRS